MRLHVVLPLTALIFAGALGDAGVRRAQPLAAPDNMCSAPHDDTAKWAAASLQALSMKVPNAYKQSFNDGANVALYRAGNRAIGIQMGDAGVSVPQSFYMLLAGSEGPLVNSSVSLGAAGSSGSTSFDHTMQSSCRAVVAGRPADITTYTWEKHAASMTNGSDVGRHYLASIRWGSVGGLPTTYVWISSTYKSDLMSLRQVFWTAHFAGFDSAAAVSMAAGPAPADTRCRDTMPAPRGAISDYLDTALFVGLVSGLAPPFPHGGNEIIVTFDSSGDPSHVLVTKSTMPDSDQARLGTIVGSNLKSQPPASVSIVRIHVGIGFTATNVELAGSGRCAHAPP